MNRSTTRLRKQGWAKPAHSAAKLIAESLRMGRVIEVRADELAPLAFRDLCCLCIDRHTWVDDFDGEIIRDFWGSSVNITEAYMPHEKRWDVRIVGRKDS